jgi:protein involved in polysaccharide export with SLBB domain
MSTKILLPFSALAVCPFILLATRNKTPNEAPANAALPETPQKPNAEAAIANADLGTTIRPGLPQSLIERLPPPRSFYSTAISDSQPAPLSFAWANIPTVSSHQQEGASVEQIVAQSLTTLPSPNRTSTATDSAAPVQPTIETIASPPAVPQMPQAAAAPESIVAPLSVPTPAVEEPQPSEPSGISQARNQAALTNQALIHPEAEPISYLSKANLKSAHFSTNEKLTVSALEIAKASVPPSAISSELPHPIARSVGDRSLLVSPVTNAPAQTVAQTAAQTAASQPNVIGETYTLGAGDRISVSFFNVPEYNGEYQIATDGSVNLPVVGGASLKGLTLREASSFIASLYQTELAHPRVTVNLIAKRPLQVSIIGEVGRPGLYTLVPDQSAQVIQAVQAAGGFTQSANLRQVQVRRSFRGQTQTIAVNVHNLLETGDSTQNLVLQDGDSLYIPAADAVDLAESGQLAGSNLATMTSSELKIALVGEVNHPGAYQLPNAAGARATLTKAIQSAGGITPTADVRQVQIRRTTHLGGTQTINVNLWQLLQSGDLNQDLILQDGDTIVLAKANQLTPAESLQLASTNLSPSEIQVNLGGEVKTPGTLQLPSNITLNQAILQTGGLNARARRSAQLIRMSPTGMLTRRTIRLDFNQDANSDSNPVLQNNDLIVVGRSTATQIADGISNFLAPIFRVLPPIQSLF